MADRVVVSQNIVEVEYQVPSKLIVTQVLVEVEYEEGTSGEDNTTNFFLLF